MKRNLTFLGSLVAGWLMVWATGGMGMVMAEETAVEKAMQAALYAEEVKGDVAAALQAYEAVSARFEEQRDLAATALFRQGECLRKLERPQEAAAAYRKLITLFPDKERLVRLSRENLVALGQSVPEDPESASAPVVSDDEQKEMARVQAMAANSPDLLFSAGENAFITAAKNGHLNVLEWFLTTQAQGATPHLAQAAHAAAEAGQLKACERLLAAGAPRTGLLAAALMNERWSVLRLLLESEADVAAVEAVSLHQYLDYRQFQSPAKFTVRGPILLLALGIGGPRPTPVDVISDILRAGADPNATGMIAVDEGRGDRRSDDQPVSALALAIRTGQPAEVIRLLIEAKADVNAWSGTPPRTALMIALQRQADEKTDEIVQALVDGGADWTKQAEDGHTTLHAAASRGHGRWIETAVERGVDVNAVTNEGRSPLIDAMRASQGYRSVPALLKAGATVDSLNAGTGPAFATACGEWPRNEESLNALEALFKAGADPNANEGTTFGTPLAHLLGSWQNVWPPAIELFIRHGARPSGVENLFGTATQAVARLSGETQYQSLMGAIRPLWKAAHWRDNPRLMQAVWLDEGEAHFESVRRNWQSSRHNAPIFAALFSVDSALEAPPTLRRTLRQREFIAQALPRQWDKATITRSADGQQTVIPVDVVAIAAGETPEPPLQWGDVLAAPAAEAWNSAVDEVVVNWAKSDATITVRMDLGGAGMVSNRPADAPPLWDLTAIGAPEILVESVIRRAGIPQALLNLGVTLRRLAVDGSMTDTPIDPRTTTERVGDGDTLVFSAPELRPTLSEEALQSGVWLCESMDGPFWPVSHMLRNSEEDVPLGYLLLALNAPHPGMFQRINWAEARLRTWEPLSPARADLFAPRDWVEQSLLTAWRMAKLQLGQILVLPAGDENSEPLPPALKEGLSTLSMDWTLQIDNAAGIPQTYQPRFFTRHLRNGQVVWSDAETSPAEGPLLPLVKDLLGASESVSGTVPSNVDVLSGQNPSWVAPDTVVQYSKPPTQQNQPQIQRGRFGGGSGRRVILPPSQ